jgi:hypothetical protein
MTIDAWLRERAPAPPQLSARVTQVMGDRVDRDAGEASVACLDAAEELLRDLLARPSAGRESALDLLTVDALVTYAFEAASETPESLGACATDAMRRLASRALP